MLHWPMVSLAKKMGLEIVRSVRLQGAIGVWALVRDHGADVADVE